MGNTYHIVQFIAPDTPEGGRRRIVWCGGRASEVGDRGAVTALRHDLGLDLNDPSTGITWLDVHIRVNEYKRLLRRYGKEAK